MNFQDVENARIIFHQKYKKGCIITALTSILVAIIVIIPYSQSGIAAIFPALFFAFFATVIGLVITLFTTNNLHKNYLKAYKTYFVEQKLRSIFSDLYYSHEQGLDKNVLRETGMINTGDRYTSNDFTSGKYKNVGFSQADVHIETEYTDSDGDTHYVTIFRGRFMIFDFKKSFNFKLELVGKKFRAYSVPGKNPTTGRKMEKISTESTEFNRSFRIFGEDGFEAYYILDPAFMVKIQDIYNQHKGKVLFSFINNRLVIGLDDGKDSFEPPRSSKPIDEAKEHQKVSADIKIITDFVEQLSLDQKLFKA